MPNPYQTPNADSDAVAGMSRLHEWSGHSIRIACRPDPKLLWLGDLLTVRVDEGPPMRVGFPLGRTLQFTFQHQGRDVVGRVIRDRGLYSWRVEYSLVIDEQPVDKGTIEIANWQWLAMGALLAAFAFAAIPFAFESSLVVVACVAACCICSLAAIRLLAGDFVSMLPFRTRSSLEDGLPESTAG